MTPSDLIKSIGVDEIEDVPPQDKNSRRWSQLRHRQSKSQVSNSRSSDRSTQS